jgi:hypothetical protein
MLPSWPWTGKNSLLGHRTENTPLYLTIGQQHTSYLAMNNTILPTRPLGSKLLPTLPWTTKYSLLDHRAANYSLRGHELQSTPFLTIGQQNTPYLTTKYKKYFLLDHMATKYSLLDSSTTKYSLPGHEHQNTPYLTIEQQNTPYLAMNYKKLLTWFWIEMYKSASYLL